MKINDYQKEALKTAIYPKEQGLEYTTLGLSGEVGEICNKVKKIIRDNNGVMSNGVRINLANELGDVMWYCAALADTLGFTLGEICETNLFKLNDRMERNVISGSGDNR